MQKLHEKHLAKLNRVSGQIDAVKRMIGENKYCVDIITQIKAARYALKAVEMIILETHIKSCLNKAPCNNEEEQKKKIEEILMLIKKYE